MRDLVARARVQGARVPIPSGVGAFEFHLGLRTSDLGFRWTDLSGESARFSMSMVVATEDLGERFAHESEREFARFLDFYGVGWTFESTCFALKRDETGRVVESFTPDFFLPEFDLFIELTTMKQSLVTRKNSKIRRMRALYPDVKVKILYARDYKKLLFKFGRLNESRAP